MSGLARRPKRPAASGSPSGATPPAGRTFGDRLAARSRRASRRSCSGSTPIPHACGPAALDAAAGARGAGDAVARRRSPPPPSPRTARALIDAAGPACVAVKPQLACFERLGAAGWAALDATVAHARAAGLLVLADGKRGDIDVTAAAYAQALVGSTPTPFGDVPGLGADAFTANPLLGRDALEPLVDGARATAPASSCSCAPRTPAPPT